MAFAFGLVQGRFDAKKRSLLVVNEHFEPRINAVISQKRKS
jgi:hypothetical protein